MPCGTPVGCGECAAGDAAAYLVQHRGGQFFDEQRAASNARAASCCARAGPWSTPRRAQSRQKEGAHFLRAGDLRLRSSATAARLVAAAERRQRWARADRGAGSSVRAVRCSGWWAIRSSTMASGGPVALGVSEFRPARARCPLAEGRAGSRAVDPQSRSAAARSGSPLAPDRNGGEVGRHVFA